MPLMQVSLNLFEKPKRLVLVQTDGTALPSGYTKVGTYHHPDDDELGYSGSHVMYHHVQEVLYKVKDTPAPPSVGFWPDNITDMQTVSILTEPPTLEIDFISPNDATVSVAVGASQQNVIFYNPEDATNKTLTVVSSDPTKATVVYDGPLGGGSKATGVTVTGVAAGTATITCTTANGKSAEFDVTVTA